MPEIQALIRFLDFNNREKAIVIWLLIGFLLALSQQSFRKAILRLLKVFFNKKIIAVIVVMLVYVGLIVFLLHQFGLWGFSLIKDTILWFVGTAFVLVMNIDVSGKEKNYFKSIIKKSLTVALIIEFIVNLYSFSLLIELILVPVVFLVTALGVVAGLESDDHPLKRVTDSVLLIYIAFLLVHIFVSIISDLSAFATSDNLRAFVLPPLLTLAYLPLHYSLALFMTYEKVFAVYDIWLKRDKHLMNYLKRKTIKVCNINLNKLQSFWRENAGEFSKLGSEDDVLSMINSFNTNRLTQ